MKVITTVAEWLEYADAPWGDEAYCESEVLTCLSNMESIEGNVFDKDMFSHLLPSDLIQVEDGLKYENGHGMSLQEDFLSWRERTSRATVVLNLPKDRLERLLHVLDEAGYGKFITNATKPEVDGVAGGGASSLTPPPVSNCSPALPLRAGEHSPRF